MILSKTSHPRQRFCAPAGKCLHTSGGQCLRDSRGLAVGSGSTDAALPVCSLQAEPGETLLAEGCVLKSTDLESGMLD